MLVDRFRTYVKMGSPMSSLPPTQLTLSGNVHDSKEISAAAGDVAVRPGSNRTQYIDAVIFDGNSWRVLDLAGFGFVKTDRVFYQPSDVGLLIRQISQVISKRKGSPVHYDTLAGRKMRMYIYRGARFSS